MVIKVSVLIAYFLIVLIIGFIARTRWKSTPDAYFLADRKLGTLILLGTMVATNFSAFTVFGTSGAGYRDGYAFFPIMGFGTGFMALTFWILGRRIRQTGLAHGLGFIFASGKNMAARSFGQFFTTPIGDKPTPHAKRLSHGHHATAY